MNSADNQMPLDKLSQLLTMFGIAGQHYCLKQLFYYISIGPVTLSSLMSTLFKLKF